MWRRNTLSNDPFNAETDAEAFAGAVTENDALFVRAHGSQPRIAPDEWSLRMHGTAGETLELHLADLGRFQAKKLTMVLECAGNGRSGLVPAVGGVPWGTDAVGCVTFRGVPLRSILPKTAAEGGTQELVFVGADQDAEGRRFERSLPLETAMDRDTLVAFEMNGQPIRPEHGGPVRLVVPGWYGVASVKWLREVRPAPTPFEGHYQSGQYVYRRRSDGVTDAPVRTLRVKSRVVSPAPGTSVPVGRSSRIWGWAWTGVGKVVAVEVSTDAGVTWRRARLGSSLGLYAWRRWSYSHTPRHAGPVEILVRAIDSRGSTQPLEPVWNEAGYGNNAASRLRLEATPRAAAAPEAQGAPEPAQETEATETGVD